jgi:hypothetical protein
MYKSLSAGNINNSEFTIGEWLDSPSGKGRFDVSRWLKDKCICAATEMRWVFPACANLAWKWQWLQEFDSTSFRMSGNSGYELPIIYQEAYFGALKEACADLQPNSSSSDVYLRELLSRDFSKAAGLGYILEAIEAADSGYGKEVKRRAADLGHWIFKNPYTKVSKYGIGDIIKDGLWSDDKTAFYGNAEVMKEISDRFSIQTTTHIREMALLISGSKLTPAVWAEDRKYTVCLTSIVAKEGFSMEMLAEAVNGDVELWYIVSKLIRNTDRRTYYEACYGDDD